MFMVLSSWRWSLREFTRFIWWMQTERRVAANPQTKPTDLDCESGDKWLIPSTSTVAIFYYYSAWSWYYLGSGHITVGNTAGVPTMATAVTGRKTGTEGWWSWNIINKYFNHSLDSSLYWVYVLYSLLILKAKLWRYLFIYYPDSCIGYGSSL